MVEAFDFEKEKKEIHRSKTDDKGPKREKSMKVNYTILQIHKTHFYKTQF